MTTKAPETTPDVVDAIRANVMTLATLDAIWVPIDDYAAVVAERDALVRAVNDERDALAAYDQTPSDRGGQRGPKGTAYRRWLDARANVAAALAKQEPKE